MKLALAKEFYFRELDRRNQLDAAPNFRVLAIGLIGGLFVQYFRLYETRPLPIVLVGLAGAAALACVIAVSRILRSFLGFRWQLIAPPSDLALHYEQLKEYKERYGLEPDQKIDDIFDDDLCKRMVEAATSNAANNNLRSELLYSASTCVAFAVAATLLAGILVAFDFLSRIEIG